MIHEVLRSGCTISADVNTDISVLGWLYSGKLQTLIRFTHRLTSGTGMATRVANDLGLNIDCSISYIPNDITPEVANLRKNIYWAVYCTDTYVYSWISFVFYNCI